MGSVKLKQHILKEVAEELDISLRVVENVIESSIDYFHDQVANNEDLLTFSFRGLCSFHANYRLSSMFKNKNEVAKSRVDKMNSLKIVSRHADIPLVWVLYRNHSMGEKGENGDAPEYLPRYLTTFGSYYSWVKKTEEINNRKVEKYFK